MLRTNAHVPKMDPVESFCEFMLEKGIPADIVQVIQRERISESSIQYMQEADLAVLFPAMGDRLHFRSIVMMLKVRWLDDIRIPGHGYIKYPSVRY